MTEPTRKTSRRSMVGVAALSFVAVGGAAAVWPLIAQMGANPSSPRDVTGVDLDGIGVGEMRTVAWRGLPIDVRHRTPEEIAEARGTRIEDLRDRLARHDGLAPTLVASDENRTKPGHARWLVVVAVCPRNNCRLITRAKDRDLGPGILWLCPCDACRFDAAGRIRSGPALENLRVPPYRIVAPGRLEIGLA